MDRANPHRPEGSPRPAGLSAAQAHHDLRHAGTTFPVSPFAPVAHGLVLLGATAAVFLAGKPQEGAMGVFLVFAGLAMIACPPRVVVEWRLWLAAAAAVGCAALALLPERFLAQPAWRRALDSTPPIAMPDTISTTPALTLFWLALLALSLLVGLFLLAHPLRSRWLLVFALAAAVTAGTYGALAIYAKQTGWVYPYASDASFGFFPNRNHTATLLFVGSLLALGILGVTLREGRWLTGLLAGAVIAVCGTGLGFYSPSRAGIVFLLIGVVCWLGGLGRRHRDPRLVVSFVAVLLACGVLFLSAGGAVRDRLLGRDSAPPAPIPAAVPSAASPAADDAVDPLHNISTDFRLKIYRDAVEMIRDFPLTGVGLGTFGLVFPQYRHASLSDSAAIHPESDWLLFTAEAGTPAALGVLVLILLAARRLGGEREHPYWPLRWGCVVAVGAAALHGLVDVPLHRVQLGWWVLAIAGLALQSARTGATDQSRVQHALFVVGGVAAAALGVALVRAEWFGGSPLPPFTDARAQEEIVATFNHQDTDRAIDLARAAVKASPMSSPLYYQLGVLLLHDEDTDAEVDRVFKAQRLLDPDWSTVPLQQGWAWITVDPNRTVALWTDFLARCRQVNRAAGAPGATPDDAVDRFRDLVTTSKPFPAAQRALGRIAVRSPEYVLAWLKNVDAPLTPEDWRGITGQADLLRRFSARDREQFLLLWYGKGDHDALESFLEDHSDWQAAAWPVHLRMLTEANQYEAAVHEVADHYHVSLTPPPPSVEGAPPDPDAPDNDILAEFAQYWRVGNVVAARHVLADAADAPGKPLPPEYWRLRAALAAQDLAWETAWQHLKRYVQQTRPLEVLP